MITIEFKGYVKFPETKTTAGGKPFNRFAVRTKQGKKPDGTPDYILVRCKDMVHKDHNTVVLPEENSFVSVKGSFNQYEYEKDGVKRTAYEVFVHNLEVAPPRESSGADFPFEEAAPF